jgi:hypothetical protein
MAKTPFALDKTLRVADKTLGVTDKTPSLQDKTHAANPRGFSSLAARSPSILSAQRDDPGGQNKITALDHAR